MASQLFRSIKAPSNRRGVTLLEIMIAFLIMCVAALGAAGIISHGHKETSHDFRRGEALQILVDRMNFLSSLPFKSLVTEIDGASRNIKEPFKEEQFGTVTIGQNSYNVTATLKKQSISFNNLMELKFPNKDYVHDKPNTWRFRKRTKSTDTYASTSGDYAYIAVKIRVDVTPINSKSSRNERTYSAITFVCNTE